MAGTTNPISVKAALAMTGHDVGDLRLPLVAATAEQEAAIRDVLDHAGVLVAA